MGVVLGDTILDILQYVKLLTLTVCILVQNEIQKKSRFQSNELMLIRTLGLNDYVPRYT